MNGRKLINSFSGFILLLFNISSANAQLFYPVSHINGTEILAGNRVTVTPYGTGRHDWWCGIGNHGIGSLDSIGGFIFSFSKPVERARIQVSGMNEGEIISFTVNGVGYTLTPSHLSDFYGNCNQEQAIISGGNLFCPPGMATVPGSAGGEINIPGPVHSLSVEANGMMNGSVFRLLIWGVFASVLERVCPGDTLRLMANTGIPNVTYSWSGPAGFSSSLRDPVIPDAGPEHEGIYTLTVTTPVDTATDTIHVQLLPVPPTPVISFPHPVCAGSPLQLSVDPIPGVSYTWSGPAGFSDSIADPLIPEAREIHEGVYTVTADNGQCTSAADSFISVSHPVSHAFYDTACSNEGYPFDGSIIFQSGTYTGTFTGSNGCDSFTTLDLTMLAAPVTVISYEPGTPPYCAGDSLTLSASGADVYTWQTDNSSVIAGNTLIIQLQQPVNTYSVEGANGQGCRDTTGITIPAAHCCRIFMPDAFTPNGDGKNDHFGPVTKDQVAGYKMEIYNRWGQMVFSSYSAQDRWDGRHRGQNAETGTYHYRITGDCLEGSGLQMKGTVTLIR